MESFLFEATIYLGAAVLAVPLAARFGFGSVLGYLAAGLVIGPLTGLAGHATDELQHFAEFGVVMMLFLIGLELDPKALWDMRHRLLGLGGLQLALTVAVVYLALDWAGISWRRSAAIGLILALSSTAIVLQTLNEKGLMNTSGGRSAFAVLLTQDIAVVPLLALLPLLSLRPPLAEGETAPSLVAGLPAWGVTGVTIAAVIAIILAGRYAVRPAFRFIAMSQLREMTTAFALLIVVGIATLMNLVGLSPALGAFLAGVMLATSEFRHQLDTDIQPFKGLLLGLFFITVGAGIDLPGFLQAPFKLLGLTLALMLAKAAVLGAIGWASGLRGRDHWLFTLSLAQAGEFGFVLVTFAQQQRVLPRSMSDDLQTIIALSMLLTPLAFIAHDRLSKRRKTEHREADEIDEQHRVIIVGAGRFGQVVNRLVRSAGFRTTLLDYNFERVQFMRRLGVKTFFGDTTRPDILRAAGIEEARVLVVALNNPPAAVEIITEVRRIRPDIRIVVRAHDRSHVYALLQAGADHVVREVFDASLRAGRYVLEDVGMSEFEAAEAVRIFDRHDRETIRELAPLWKPGVAVADNEEYLNRAMELEQNLHNVLLAELSADASITRARVERPDDE